MVRLIDADKLILHLNDYALQEAPFKGEDGNIKVYDAIVQCMEAVKEQPTTYDVDRVVEQLNKAKKYNLDLADTMLDIQTNGTTRHFICLEDAIEIVKVGGNKNE